MAYVKYLTGPILTDNKGSADLSTGEIKGKIIKVRIDYNTTNPDTKLKLETMEGETICDLPEWFKDKVLYPMHSVLDEHFIQTPHHEWNEMREFVSVGPIRVIVSDTDPESESDVFDDETDKERGR